LASEVTALRFLVVKNREEHTFALAAAAYAPRGLRIRTKFKATCNHWRWFARPGIEYGGPMPNAAFQHAEVDAQSIVRYSEFA
jgi:hypothetical protein